MQEGDSSRACLNGTSLLYSPFGEEPKRGNGFAVLEKEGMTGN